mgnify:FL=1
MQLNPVELYRRYHVNPRKMSAEEVRQRRQGLRKARREAIHARLLYAVESPNQLREVMVDFWFNHFNVANSKGMTGFWVGAYERDVIRPHALGQFRALLGATAKHPAMLFYLDNWRNRAPDGSMSNGRPTGLNENYARELLELHTLGSDGPYIQDDVEALARIFTGWTLSRDNPGTPPGSGFRFAPGRHDRGSKVFLKTAIDPAGQQEGELALDMLASHPATARHISFKLAQYFVSDTPSQTLIDSLAAVFQSQNGNIKAVLKALFTHQEFWHAGERSPKFKTPYQYILSAVRAMGVKAPMSDALQRLNGMLNQLGMPVQGCRTPDGYPQTQADWLDADEMMRRVSFAVGIANFRNWDSVRLVSADAATPKGLFETLGPRFSRHTKAVVDQAPPYLKPGLILGSPEMMYR